MAKQLEDHAGSGLDNPDPKILIEKVTDGLKKIVPSKPAPDQKPESVPATVIPPAD
jgi:hypothetical protein